MIKKAEIKDRISREILISNSERAILEYALLMVSSLALFFVSIFYVALAVGVLTIQNTLYAWFDWAGSIGGSLCVIIPAMGLIFGLMGTITGIIGMGKSYTNLRRIKGMNPMDIEKEEMKYALRRELMIGNIDENEYEKRLKILEERYR